MPSPSPKDGKAGTPVTPAEPTAAQEADKSDPGEVEQVKAEQQQTRTGKYGAAPVKPHKPLATKDEKKKKSSWIAIKMVDEQSKPVIGMVYRITLPDETVTEGTLDEEGSARIEGIDPGDCKVTFPTLDQDAWERV
jgi:hypothetical protein